MTQVSKLMTHSERVSSKYYQHVVNAAERRQAMADAHCIMRRAIEKAAAKEEREKETRRHLLPSTSAAADATEAAEDADAEDAEDAEEAPEDAQAADAVQDVDEMVSEGVKDKIGRWKVTSKVTTLAV